MFTKNDETIFRYQIEIFKMALVIERSNILAEMQAYQLIHMSKILLSEYGIDINRKNWISYI